MKEKKKEENFLDEFIKGFNPRDAIAVESPLVNSYGLDLTDSKYIGYNTGEIQIEVVGGVDESSLRNLRVTLNIRKKGSESVLEIYRSPQVDLFNDNQVERFIQEASEKIKVPRLQVQEAIGHLTEKLDHYRRDRPFKDQNPNHTPSYAVKDLSELKAKLKKKSLTAELREVLDRAGMVDVNLGLQLYILGLSRLTSTPLHVIVQGNMVQSNEFFSTFKKVIPKEQLKEATSITKNALSYSPDPDYWKNKTLLLHKLQGLFHKESVLQEYIKQGEVKRIVTEPDRNTGTYRSAERNVDQIFQIMGYTSLESHPIFNSASLICLPQTESRILTQRFYQKEIWAFSGQTEQSTVDYNREILQDIQRHLKPYRVVNPYLDQIDLQVFFQDDLKRLRQFLQITNLITLLHQEQIPRHKKDGKHFIEVEVDYMLKTLELFQNLWLLPEEQLYFSVSSTFNSLKKGVLKKHKREARGASFKVKDFRPKSMAFSTFSKHIKQLEEYNKIKRVGGSNRDGYDFQIVEWKSTDERLKLYKNLIHELKKLRN